MPDRMDDLLRGSSLDPAQLYVACEPCRLAGRGNRIARDPFDDDECVYGHPITTTAAVAEAVTLLDAIHRPDPWADQCLTCGPEGGRWPCASREVADDLRRGVLGEEGER